MTVCKGVLLGLAVGVAVCLHAPTSSAQSILGENDKKRLAGRARTLEHFDPRFNPGEIVVSFGDRRLYYVTGVREAVSYPIAIPREEDRWQGRTTVSDKKINPSWTPTAEMLAENPHLPAWIPGGHPMNPLGVRALYLGSSAYRIHGTDAPGTIGTAVSRGCIRMYNRDVLDLFQRAPIGTRVTVTWHRFTTGARFAARPRDMHRAARPLGLRIFSMRGQN